MNELMGPLAVVLITSALIVGLVLRTRSVRKRLTGFLAPRGFTPVEALPELSLDGRPLFVAQAFAGPLAPGVNGHFVSCASRGIARRMQFYLGVLVPESVEKADERLAQADRVNRLASGVLALWESKDSPEEVARVLTKVEAALK